MNFGHYIDKKNCFKILDKALDLGINFIDTADAYGKSVVNNRIGDGYTEEIIGEWISNKKNIRDKIVLATKAYVSMGTGPNDRGLSAYHIKRACDASLKGLKVDYIDLYQMHHIDRVTPWEEIWQAMEQLVKERKIIYIGSSKP